MTDQITHLLNQIDQLDQQATKEPWTASGGKVYEPSGYPLPGCTSCGENEATYEGQDAEFIALARTALPAMSKALRAVMDLEDESLDGDLQGYEIDQYVGYNQALRSVREAITDQTLEPNRRKRDS